MQSKRACVDVGAATSGSIPRQLLLKAVVAKPLSLISKASLFISKVKSWRAFNVFVFFCLVAGTRCIFCLKTGALYKPTYQLQTCSLGTSSKQSSLKGSSTTRATRKIPKLSSLVRACSVGLGEVENLRVGLDSSREAFTQRSTVLS